MKTKLLYTVDDIIEITGIGRTKVFELFKTGKLKKVKIGSRTYVHPDAARAFVESLTEKSAA